jgi:hypothetical protein
LKTVFDRNVSLRLRRSDGFLRRFLLLVGVVGGQIEVALGRPEGRVFCDGH